MRLCLSSVVKFSKLQNDWRACFENVKGISVQLLHTEAFYGPTYARTEAEQGLSKGFPTEQCHSLSHKYAYSLLRPHKSRTVELPRGATHQRRATKSTDMHKWGALTSNTYQGGTETLQGKLSQCWKGNFKT